MRLAKAAVPLVVLVSVLSLGWLQSRPDDKTAPHPDGYALDMVVHGPRYLSDASILGRAEHTMVIACMKDGGFTFPLDASASPVEPSTDDMTYRREHGYGIIEAAENGDDQSGVIPAGYDEALTGGTNIQVRFRGGTTIMVSSGGCRGQARATLAGSVERWATASYAADYLNDDLVRAVAADPAMSLAAAQWRECMRRAGHPAADYGTPRASIEQEFAEHGPSPALRATERKLAVADGECLTSAHVLQTSESLRRNAAATMPADWADELMKAAQIRRAAVDNALRRTSTG